LLLLLGFLLFCLLSRLDLALFFLLLLNLLHSDRLELVRLVLHIKGKGRDVRIIEVVLRQLDKFLRPLLERAESRNLIVPILIEVVKTNYFLLHKRRPAQRSQVRCRTRINQKKGDLSTPLILLFLLAISARSLPGLHFQFILLFINVISIINDHQIETIISF
jgi:hypothetical protein